MNKKILTVSIILLLSILCLQNISIALNVNIETSKENEKQAFTSSKLPSYFSWRDINGVDFTTPIRSQTTIC